MTKPLSRWSRQRLAATLAAAGIAAGTLAPPVASAAPAPGPGAAAGRCAGFGAAAAGDLVTLRLLDLRALGLPLPALTNLSLATSRAGFSGGAATSAAQGRYVEGTAVTGFKPPLGPIDAVAHRVAPPATEPLVVNPSQMNLGPVRAGSGNLTARAAFAKPGTCDHRSGADSEATAAMTDTAVLPATRTVVGAADNQSTRARTGMVGLRGGAGAEAEATSSLAKIAIFEALKVRVASPALLRVVAGGSARTSTVEHQDPLIAVDLPDGRSVQLDQTTRAIDFSLPGAGTQPVPGLPALPANALPDLLGALPGGAAALPALGNVLGSGRGLPVGAPDAVPPSAGSAAPPSVPGLPPLAGVPAVGGLLGGGSALPTTFGQNSLILRLSGGEISKEITDTGVHAKAITLRLKVILARGEAVNTLIDLCVGVLEVAATAPSAGTRGDRPDRGSGGGGYGGDEPDAGGAPEEPTAPEPDGGVAGGVVPTGSKLPLTGINITAIVGAAVVLLLAGRLLMVMTRRRTG